MFNTVEGEEFENCSKEAQRAYIPYINS